MMMYEVGFEDDLELEREGESAEVRGVKGVGLRVEEQVLVGERELDQGLVDDKMISECRGGIFLQLLKHACWDFFKKLGGALHALEEEDYLYEYYSKECSINQKK